MQHTKVNEVQCFEISCNKKIWPPPPVPFHPLGKRRPSVLSCCHSGLRRGGLCWAHVPSIRDDTQAGCCIAMKKCHRLLLLLLGLGIKCKISILTQNLLFSRLAKRTLDYFFPAYSSILRSYSSCFLQSEKNYLRTCLSVQNWLQHFRPNKLLIDAQLWLQWCIEWQFLRGNRHKREGRLIQAKRSHEKTRHTSNNRATGWIFSKLDGKMEEQGLKPLGYLSEWEWQSLKCCAKFIAHDQGAVKETIPAATHAPRKPNLNHIQLSQRISGPRHQTSYKDLLGIIFCYSTDSLSRYIDFLFGLPTNTWRVVKWPLLRRFYKFSFTFSHNSTIERKGTFSGLLLTHLLPPWNKHSDQSRWTYRLLQKG